MGGRTTKADRTIKPLVHPELRTFGWSPPGTNQPRFVVRPLADTRAKGLLYTSLGQRPR